MNKYEDLNSVCGNLTQKPHPVLSHSDVGQKRTQPQTHTGSENLYNKSQTDRHRYATVKIREMTTNIRLPHICRRVLLNREGGTKGGRVGTKNSTNLSNKDFIICKGRH